MGCDRPGAQCWDNENPAHKVQITHGFYMSQFPVTQAEWNAVMGQHDSQFKDCANCPVERISWSMAQEFVRRISIKERKNYRLPTEAEWEYAARAGSKASYYWGDEVDGDYLWYNKNSAGRTHPVGEKKPNAFGLYDMLGNIPQWCYDRFSESYFAESAARDPAGPFAGEERVFRGGNWRVVGDNAKVSTRYSGKPGDQMALVGIRLVLAADDFDPVTDAHRASVLEGEGVRWVKNPDGGFTQTADLKANHPLHKARGFSRIQRTFDAAGVLRRAEIEGRFIRDNNIFFGSGARQGDLALIKIVDTFDEKGMPLTEETWHDPDANTYEYSHVKRIYQADGVRITFAYPDRPLRNQFQSYLEEVYTQYGNRTFQKMGLIGPNENRDLIVEEISTAEVRLPDYAAMDPVAAAATKLLVDHQKKTTSYTKGRITETNVEKGQTYLEPMPRLRFIVRTTPESLTLSWDELAHYYGRFAKTDLEKVTMAFWGVWRLAEYKTNDPTAESAVMIQKVQGVCENISYMFRQLARAMGLRIVGIGEIVSTGELHAWDKVRIGNRYYVMDATWQSFFEDPEEFIKKHWPNSPYDQCLDQPYESYSSYKARNHLARANYDSMYSRRKGDLEYDLAPTMLYLAEVRYQGTWYKGEVFARKNLQFMARFKVGELKKQELFFPADIRWLSSPGGPIPGPND